MHILKEALERELVALDKRGLRPARLSEPVRMALQWVMRHGEDFPEVAVSVGTLVSTYLSHSKPVAEDVIQSFYVRGGQTFIHLGPGAPHWIDEAEGMFFLSPA